MHRTPPDARVALVKVKLEDELGVPEADQRLIYGGKVLTDAQTLEDILRDSEGRQTFHLVVPPPPAAPAPPPVDLDEVRERPRELKRLARQGIPPARRGEIWQQLAGTDQLRRSERAGYFDSLVQQEAQAQGEPTASVRQIELDLARTFPGHRYLGADGGIEELRSVLVAYSRRDASVGCECMRGMGCGMGPVTWVSKWPRRDRRSGPTGRHVQGVCA